MTFIWDINKVVQARKEKFKLGFAVLNFANGKLLF